MENKAIEDGFRNLKKEKTLKTYIDHKCKSNCRLAGRKESKWLILHL